jgi:opine dehydrogenase
MLRNGPRFAVLGSGHSAHAFAADITLKGYPVALAELPAFAGNLAAIRANGGIEIRGEVGQGFAKLELITSDIGEAVRGADVLIVATPGFGHEPWARAMAPHFVDGQFVVFVGNFGALRFRQWMRGLEVSADVTPVETVSLLYATRSPRSGEVDVLGVKGRVPTAALPARRTAAFLERIAPVFPQYVASENVLAISLGNVNPIVHTPMAVHSAGRMESSKGTEWNLYRDGATESVARVMLALDGERLSLLRHLGIEGTPVIATFRSFYGEYPEFAGGGTLSQMLRNSTIHTDPAFPAPETINTRYVTEDVLFGLGPWSALGRAWGVPTPTADSLIHLSSVLLGENLAEAAVAAEELGIAGLSRDEIVASVR